MAKEDNKRDERMIAIGAKFRSMRKEAGYTSYDMLAYDLGISRNQVSRIERGENITIETLLFMLDAFGVSPSEFFAEFDNPVPSRLKNQKLP